MKRFIYLLLLVGLASLPLSGYARSRTTRAVHHVRSSHVSSSHVSSSHVQESASARRKMTHLQHGHRHVAATRTVLVRGRNGKLHRVVVRHRYYEHFTGDSFAETDLTRDDVVAGEDPVVREAALAALGNMNGTVVSIDPSNGRILAMVNQKLALSSGAEPCSTIKVSVALAALQEGIVTKDTQVNLGGWSMNLTEALAHSNNLYFETLGRRLGFERVDLVFRISKLAGEVLRPGFDLFELLGFQIALDLEATQVDQQGALLA
ncbi:MAG: penicillin-binding transpeptidase domain-containing protein, partial [Acidobacteriaceae bacterium]